MTDRGRSVRGDQEEPKNKKLGKPDKGLPALGWTGEMLGDAESSEAR